MKFNEKYTVENHIIKYLKDKLGYRFLSKEEFSKLREYENEFIIKPLFLEAVKKINNIDDEKAESIFREVKKLDTNEDFLIAMRDGVNLIDSETKKHINYQIVDWTRLDSRFRGNDKAAGDNNDFVITTQLYF
jgi:hypothetical protein